MAEPQSFFISRWHGGVVKEYASDDIELYESPESINTEINKRGSLKKTTRGYQELWSDAAVLTPYDLWKEFDRAGNEWLFKFAGTVLKIGDATLERFDTIDTEFTAGSIFGHVVFENTMYYGNQDDTARSIDLSKITRLNGALAGAESTITVDDTTNFASTGTVMIKGTAVTYTGKSSTTFTGCSGTPAAEDNSLVVVQPSTHASTPKGNIYLLLSGRLCISGVSTAYATLYGSKATDRTDFTVAGSGADDAFALTLPSKINVAKTIIDQDNNQLVLTMNQNGQSYFVTVSDDATAGTVAAFKVAPFYGTALNNQSVVQAENDIFHIDVDNQVRSLARSKDSNSIFTTRLTDGLATHFKKNLDFSVARMLYTETELLVACKTTGGTVNNRLWRFNHRLGAWHERRNVNAVALAVYDNLITFLDSSVNKVFQISEDTWNDDDEAIYFEHHTKDFDVTPLQFERLWKVRMIGLISENAEITIEAWKDFKSLQLGEFTLAGNNENIVGTTSSQSGSFGITSFGLNPFAYSSGTPVRVFIAELRLNNLPDLENFRLVFTNEQPSIYFELFKMKLHVETKPENYFPSRQIAAN